jgi:hypothetical protein
MLNRPVELSALLISLCFLGGCSKTANAKQEISVSDKSEVLPKSIPASTNAPIAGETVSPKNRFPEQTGLSTHTPLLAGEVDPRKRSTSSVVNERPHDPQFPVPGDSELVTREDGSQFVRTVIVREEEQHIEVDDIHISPVNIENGVVWLVGTVLVNNYSKCNILDVQISLLKGEERIVLLGGRKFDRKNPLATEAIQPQNGRALAISCPVKFSEAANAVASQYIEVEIAIDGPPGLLVKREQVEVIRVDANGRPLPTGPYNPNR